MKALIGRKIGMTQTFGEKGALTAVTLVQAEPNTITQIRNLDKDGYMALQLGFEEQKKLSKSQQGQLKASGANSKIKREFRLATTADEAKVGDKLDVSQFSGGDEVTVVAVSRGKGFAGTIKRHNFHRGPMSHGSKNKRGPGSIGSMYPQKVYKGRKMAGRMGAAQVSLRKVKVLEVDSAAHILALKGPVPGPRKGLVLIRG